MVYKAFAKCFRTYTADLAHATLCKEIPTQLLLWNNIYLEGYTFLLHQTVRNIYLTSIGMPFFSRVNTTATGDVKLLTGQKLHTKK